jgi:methylated-DNA-[protein]-cysteine S-methyltransferase
MGLMSQYPSHGYLLFDTAVGHCGLAWGERGITGVLLPEDDREETRRRMQRLHPAVAESDEASAAPVAREAAARIRGLLQGYKDDLQDLPLDMSDVPAFHVRVYRLVRGIGPGETMTYGEVAERLGEPSAARAVGQALARNPFAPVVPCHRVLAAATASGNFRSGGFSAGGGIVTKLRMLQTEGARFSREQGLFD